MKKMKRVTHGGRRVGSGRKRKGDPLVTYSVHITTQQADLLRRWGGDDLSAGLRWLVDAAKAFIKG